MSNYKYTCEYCKLSLNTDFICIHTENYDMELKKRKDMLLESYLTDKKILLENGVPEHYICYIYHEEYLRGALFLEEDKLIQMIKETNPSVITFDWWFKTAAVDVREYESIKYYMKNDITKETWKSMMRTKM